MHTKPMSESEGELSTEKPLDRPCPKCGGQLVYQSWSSSDGGYVDDKTSCKSCSYVHWVDGIDS